MAEGFKDRLSVYLIGVLLGAMLGWSTCAALREKVIAKANLDVQTIQGYADQAIAGWKACQQNLKARDVQ